MQLATSDRSHQPPPVPPRPSRQVVAEALKRSPRPPCPTRQAPPPPRNTKPWRSVSGKGPEVEHQRNPQQQDSHEHSGRTLVYESSQESSRELGDDVSRNRTNLSDKESHRSPDEPTTHCRHCRHYTAQSERCYDGDADCGENCQQKEYSHARRELEEKAIEGAEASDSLGLFPVTGLGKEKSVSTADSLSTSDEDGGMKGNQLNAFDSKQSRKPESFGKSRLVATRSSPPNLFGDAATGDGTDDASFGPKLTSDRAGTWERGSNAIECEDENSSQLERYYSSLGFEEMPPSIDDERRIVIMKAGKKQEVDKMADDGQVDQARKLASAEKQEGESSREEGGGLGEEKNEIEGQVSVGSSVVGGQLPMQFSVEEQKIIGDDATAVSLGVTVVDGNVDVDLAVERNGASVERLQQHAEANCKSESESGLKHERRERVKKFANYRENGQLLVDTNFISSIQEKIAMSSLQGLPPLPRSLSGFNLNSSRTADSCEPPPPPARSSSKVQRTSKSSIQSSPRPSPPARQLTTLDTQLAILRREMFGLRQLDLSLLSQLWSLNESIQEFRQLLQEQEDRAPSPSPSSEEGDESTYTGHPPPPPRRPPAVGHHHRPPRPPRPARPPPSDESPSSEEYGAV